MFISKNSTHVTPCPLLKTFITRDLFLTLLPKNLKSKWVVAAHVLWGRHYYSDHSKRFHDSKVIAFSAIFSQGGIFHTSHEMTLSFIRAYIVSNLMRVVSYCTGGSSFQLPTSKSVFSQLNIKLDLFSTRMSAYKDMMGEWSTSWNNQIKILKNQ